MTATQANYVIPDGAATTAYPSGEWEVPGTYSAALAAAQSPERRVLQRYRRILDNLPIQQRSGDASVLIAELAADEGSIREAEELVR